MPTKTLKWLPRLSGDNVITTAEQFEVFEKTLFDNDVVHEDVAMKLLVNSLDGNAFRWFKGLRNNSTTGCDDLIQKFKDELDCKYDNRYLLKPVVQPKEGRE